MLKALVKCAGTSGNHAVEVRFAQQDPSTKHERKVSARRARTVVAYLKSKGVKGSYVVRREQVTGPGSRAGWVDITATYRTGR